MPRAVALLDSKQIQFRQLGDVVCQIRAPFRGLFEEKSSPSPRDALALLLSRGGEAHCRNEGPMAPKRFPFPLRM
jgi:hypothetical protein